MNNKIYLHASKGGQARAAKLTPEQRSTIARNAAASKGGHKQAISKQNDENPSLATKYAVLKTFLEAKGVDIDELIEQSTTRGID